MKYILAALSVAASFAANASIKSVQLPESQTLDIGNVYSHSFGVLVNNKKLEKLNSGYVTFTFMALEGAPNYTGPAEEIRDSGIDAAGVPWETKIYRDYFVDPLDKVKITLGSNLQSLTVDDARNYTPQALFDTPTEGALYGIVRYEMRILCERFCPDPHVPVPVPVWDILGYNRHEEYYEGYSGLFEAYAVLNDDVIKQIKKTGELPFKFEVLEGNQIKMTQAQLTLGFGHSAVPEPGSLAFVVAGLPIAMLGLARRKVKRTVKG